MNTKKLVTFASALIVLLLFSCGCDGEGETEFLRMGTPTPLFEPATFFPMLTQKPTPEYERALTPYPFLSSPRETIPADWVNTIAADLYDAVVANENVQDQMAEIFKIFGAYILNGEDSEVEFKRLSETGESVVLDVQLDAMSRGFANRMMVTLDSFIVYAADLGISAADPPGSLTLPYLTEKLSPLLDKEEFTADEILPALVLALGHERASRTNRGITDPVWGDDVLDPMQFALLSYDFAYSATDVNNKMPGMFGKSKFFKWIRTSVRTFVASEIAHMLVCDSLTVHSYFMQVTASPHQVFHRQPEQDRPSESQIATTLKFERPDAKRSWQEWVISYCGLPKSGSVPRNDINWSLAGQLPKHGVLVDVDTETRQDGTAYATYQVNVDEVVPRSLQKGPGKGESGTVIAQAVDLLAPTGDAFRRLVLEPYLYEPLTSMDQSWINSDWIEVLFWGLPKLQLEVGFWVPNAIPPMETYAKGYIQFVINCEHEQQSCIVESDPARLSYDQKAYNPGFMRIQYELDLTLEGEYVPDASGGLLYLTYEWYGTYIVTVETGEGLNVAENKGGGSIDLEFPLVDGYREEKNEVWTITLRFLRNE